MRTHSSPTEWIASGPDRSKIALPGTDRARPPAQTMLMANRAAAAVEVTRVADLTGLDTIGIPTYQATRPTSRTLSVSMGKGVTSELARLSAVMEAIETWHVEQPLSPAVTAAAPREIGDRLGYPLAGVPQLTPSLLHDGLPLDWVEGRVLSTGASTLVPMDAVRLTFERIADWTAPAFLASTNGLASGNTLAEATLHALYEVIERDALTGVITDRGPSVLADPRSLGSAVIDGLCDTIERAGAFTEVRLVPSPTGLPCFMSWIACPDYPAAMFGFGCHLSPEIALSRALTEAAQTRLSYISGARDDLKSEVGQPGARRQREPSAGADLRSLTEEPAAGQALLDDLDEVTRRVTAAFGSSPLVVDLTREDIGVPVVKAVVPGCRVCLEVL